MSGASLSKIRAYNRTFRRALDGSDLQFAVAVIAEPQPCLPCASLVGVYDSAALPELPVVGCLLHGCECWYAAVVGAASDAPAGKRGARDV